MWKQNNRKNSIPQTPSRNLLLTHFLYSFLASPSLFPISTSTSTSLSMVISLLQAGMYSSVYIKIHFKIINILCFYWKHYIWYFSNVRLFWCIFMKNCRKCSVNCCQLILFPEKSKHIWFPGMRKHNKTWKIS